MTANNTRGAVWRLCLRAGMGKWLRRERRGRRGRQFQDGSAAMTTASTLSASAMMAPSMLTRLSLSTMIGLRLRADGWGLRVESAGFSIDVRSLLGLRVLLITRVEGFAEVVAGTERGEIHLLLTHVRLCTRATTFSFVCSPCSPKLAPSPPASAPGTQPASPPALPVLAPAPSGGDGDKGSPARKQGRHIVCQLIGCMPSPLYPPFCPVLPSLLPPPRPPARPPPAFSWQCLVLFPAARRCSCCSS